MMPRYRLLFAALLWEGALFAAFEEKPVSARSAALGESLVAVPGTLESAQVNPAALGFAEGAGVTLGATRLYGESDLPSNSLAGLWRTQRRGGWGGFLTGFGSSLYREWEAGVGWGGRVTERVGVGLTLKRQEIRMERYGNLGAFQADVGMLGRPFSLLHLGFAVKNITQSQLGATPETPPAFFSAGASLHALPQGPTALAVVQESGGSVSWRVGQEAWIHPSFALRAGFETNPNRFGFGVGVRRAGLGFDYGMLTHPSLPDQHHLNLSYSFFP